MPQTKPQIKPETETLEIASINNGKLPFTKKQIILIGIIILVFVAGYFGKSLFLVALVNNQPITRMSLDLELEKQGGKQVLDSKITEILILDEAKKQNISVTQTEIDGKIKEIETKIEAQGQKLDTLLSQQGQTRKDLGKQIKMQVIVEKILGKDIQVTDKEVEDYFKTNSTYYPKGTKLEEKSAEIKSTLSSQKLSAKVQPWLDNLKKSAKIYSFLNF